MNCIIIGAGGHSNIVTDILKLNGYNIIGYYDDNIKNDKILGKMDEIKNDINYKYICAIGDNKLRKNIVEKYYYLNWISIIHPSAIISSSVKIGIGSVICAGVIIQPNTIIGNHIIVNTKSSIDHDCIIENYCHICPGVILCGYVNIGEMSFIGAGTTIINMKKIGKNVIIGAGSLVIRNIENDIKTYGVPTKINRSNQ